MHKLSKPPVLAEIHFNFSTVSFLSRTVFTQNFSKSVKFTFLLFGELGRVEEKVDDSQVFPANPQDFIKFLLTVSLTRNIFLPKLKSSCPPILWRSMWSRILRLSIERKNTKVDTHKPS